MPTARSTPAPSPAPAASEPVGTPPAGGRWTWDGQAWQLLPEPDQDTKE